MLEFILTKKKYKDIITNRVRGIRQKWIELMKKILSHNQHKNIKQKKYV